MLKQGVLNLHFVERCVLEIAMVKAKGNSETVARGKLETQHLALNELHTLKRGLLQFNEAEVAIMKRAINKAIAG